MNKHSTPKCGQCKILMRRGQYIKETLKKGRGDFWDNGPAVTVSAGGAGKLADCWKCSGCGESRL